MLCFCTYPYNVSLPTIRLLFLCGDTVKFVYLERILPNRKGACLCPVVLGLCHGKLCGPFSRSPLNPPCFADCLDGTAMIDAKPNREGDARAYFYSPVKGEWIPWVNMLPELEIPDAAEMGDIVVPNAYTAQYNSLLTLLLNRDKKVRRHWSKEIAPERETKTDI